MSQQRWEYMCVQLAKSYGMNYRANGEKIADWKDQPLHEVFRRLGAVGYEFVAFDGSQYIFKRPAARAENKAG